MMNDNELVYKSQDVNYLGFLEAQLRNMTGVDTLTYELIQNADDVRDEEGRFLTKTLSFDITDEALIVRNDGRFRPVDFARLQRIAGGAKREEQGVTGAFGLGFLAVYQVTDAPEIFSSSRHWIIRPDAPAAQRIEERQIAAISGTRFRLPWAVDPTSTVRRTLRLEAIRPEQLDDFAAQMSAAVSQAAIFIKRLEQMEVRRNGELIRSVTRRRQGDRLQLTDETGQMATWLLFDTDFAAAADRLREQYPWQIETGRQCQVQIALPLTEALQMGRLYAGLPTADGMPIACHLNGDFFPTTDRKRLHFSDGYQAAWNQAIVKAASALLADRLPELPRLLPPTRIWHLLQTVFETAQQTEQAVLPIVFATFWQEILPRISQTSLFYSAEGSWLRPAEGRLLPSASVASSAEIISVLQRLQIPVLHPSLLPYTSLLQQMGVPSVAIADIAVGLRGAGLTKATRLHEAPPFLRRIEDWRPLWQLLDALFRFLPPAERVQAEQALNGCAAALAADGVLRPLSQLVRGRPEAQALFPDLPWLHPELATDGFHTRFLPEFGVRQGVDYFLALPIDRLEAAWRRGQLDLPRLFHWFEMRQIEIFAEDPALAADISRVPLCPVDGELRPLADLFLPGGFDDPLKSAALVDLDAVGGRHHFLADLGVSELDFDTYLRRHLPRLFKQQPDLPSDRRHRLLALLVKRLGEISDDESLQAVLRDLPLIPCMDGTFRPGPTVYRFRDVMALLGQGGHIAEPVESAAAAALYDWLGVRTAPAVDDLVQALRNVGQMWGADPLDKATYVRVINCWEALAERLQAGEVTGKAFAPLRGRPLIPDGRRILAAPESVLIADRADLAAQFSEWAAALLPADISWLAAAEAVGVRPLSRAVSVGVANAEAAFADSAVQARIAAREPLLKRLLWAEIGAEPRVDADFLTSMQVLILPELHIQLDLHLGGQRVATAVEHVGAKWVEGVLYVERSGDAVRWTAVARELARVLVHSRKTGGLALGIREVLAAESVAEATAVLDELGYP